MVDLDRIEWLQTDRIQRNLYGQGSEGFVDLCNMVLNELALEAEADPGCIRSTLAVFERDDGVDGYCVEAGLTVSHWIPDPDLVAYQFKSGANRSSPREIARDDIAGKNGVREVLDSGGSFVYITPWDPRANFEEDIRDEMEDQGLGDARDRVHYINGNMLAEKIKRLPGLLASIRGIPLGGLLTFSEWRRMRDLGNPFVANEALQSRLHDLRDRLESPGAMIRVVGRPGDGKTRTVLEAINGSTIEPRTVYASHPDRIPDGFLQYLRRAEGVKCTLVADEVDAASMRDLEDDIALARSDDVSLVLIGPSGLRRRPTRQAEVLEIEPLSRELLEAIVRSANRGIPDELADDIARICSGSPSFALLLAAHVDREREVMSRQRLLADRGVRDAINDAIGIDLTDERWRAAAAVGLLDYVGWRRDASVEADRLFQAANLDVATSRSAVEQMNDNLGLFPLAGDVRYLSPEVLAQHLAAKQIREWSRDQLRNFLAGLNPRMIEGFTARVRELGSAIEGNQTLVEDLILGEQGPFQTLADLEQGRASGVIRQLAGPYRYAMIRLLRRLIEPASKEELHTATECRRDLVRALEELLWFERTFQDAASLLLQLAAAENEGWGNNATGIWTETFQTRLGRTEAGGDRRLRVVQGAVESEDPDERRLAAQAISAGLKFGRTTRFGTPPRDLEDAPVEAWYPETWGDWANLANGYLALLDSILDDPVDEVRRNAIEGLEDGLRAALFLPGVEDRWFGLAARLVDAGFDERLSLIRGIRQEIQRAERELEQARADLTEDRITQLEDRLVRLEHLAEDLEGDDFESRFRRALTIEFHEVDVYVQEGVDLREAREQIRERLSELAREVLEDPELLDGQWTWLVEERPVHMGTWLHELGQQDCERNLSQTVAENAFGQKATWSWLSIYDLGFLAGCVDNESFVHDRVQRLREEGAPGEQILDFLVRVGYCPDRFELVLELFQEGEVAGSQVARLKYSGWTSEVDIEEVERLIEQSLGDPTDPEVNSQLITFLHGFLEQHPEYNDRLRHVVVNLLSGPVSQDASVAFEYEWAELAESCLPEAASDIVEAATRRIAQLEVSYDDRLPALVHRAWEVGNKPLIFAETISPWLESDSGGAWWVRKAIAPFPLWDLDTNTICEWIAENPDVRAGRLARMIGAPTGEAPSELHAALLERFDHCDVGDSFFADLLEGTWTGSASDRTRSLIARAERWTGDDRTSVRDWAEQIVGRLEEALERDQQREAEMEVRRGQRPPRGPAGSQ